MRSRRMLKIDLFMRKGNKKVHYLVVALVRYPNLQAHSLNRCAGVLQCFSAASGQTAARPAWSAENTPETRRWI